MTSQIPFLDVAAMTREVLDSVEPAWRRVLESSRFVGGEAVEEFEAAWAAYCQVPHALGVANGTDAIQLTLTALGIGPGDEVVLPTNTFVATAEAVVLSGATPRFADICPDTLLLTAELLEAAINRRTKAVIVVHLYGQMPDMDALCRVADKAGIAVIEDAAQAHGATWRGRRAGSIGRAGCFSFYPGKNLGAFGDAGAVVTTDEGLADRIRVLRDHGRAVGSHYRHELVGTNSRLDALQAEVPGMRGVYHLAVLRVPERTRVQRHLAEMGVQAQVHYPIPCHQQEPYRRFAGRPLPTAERCAEEVLSLPMFPHMTDDQVTRVCDAVHAALGGREHRVA